jgi:hypothetical protein
MKALYIGLAIAASFAFAGCCNLKARTAPAIPCMSNPCPTACKPCAPAPAKYAKKAVKKEDLDK